MLREVQIIGYGHIEKGEIIFTWKRSASIRGGPGKTYVTWRCGRSTSRAVNRNTEVEKQRFVCLEWKDYSGRSWEISLERGSETRPAQDLPGSGMPVSLCRAQPQPPAQGLGLPLCLGFPTGFVILLPLIPSWLHW